MSSLGRYFWFICFAVILVNIAIWRSRVRKLIALHRITRDHADAFLRATTFGLAAPCLLLGLISLRQHYSWPSCLGVLSFRDSALATGSIIMITWWLVVLRWVWIGQGASLLSRIGPVLWNLPSWNTTFSPKLIRFAVTAMVVIAASSSIASRSAEAENACGAPGAAG